MDLTLWLIVINLVMWPAFVWLYLIDRLPLAGFLTGLTMVLLFNVSLLVGRVLYTDLVAQMQSKLAGIDTQQTQVTDSVESLKSLEQSLKPMIETQSRLTLRSLAIIDPGTSTDLMRQRWQMATKIVADMQALNGETAIDATALKPLQQAILATLTEQFSDLMLQEIGRRNFTEFLRTRPREQWTDELFVQEASSFLKKQKLMNTRLADSIKQIQDFRSDQIL